MDRAALDKLLSQKKKALKGLDLTEIDVQRPKRVDLSKTLIEGCTLSNLDFSGVSFAGAKIKNTWINGCNFTGCDFSDAKPPKFIGLTLRGAKFPGSNLAKHELSQCDLQGADFTGATLTGANLRASDLRGACFRDAVLTKADLSGTQIKGADFTGATLDGVDWDEVDLKGAIGLSMVESDGDDEDGEAYATTSSEGTPLIAIPAAFAAQWTPADTERAIDACDGKGVVKAGYLATASVTVGEGRALVLEGELDTGFVPIEGGGVLVRGGSFEDLDEAKAAVEKAIKQKKGWQAFPQTIAIGEGGLWIFDSGYPGGDSIEDFPGDFGVVLGKLAEGTYKLEILGEEGDSGPVVFIRLTL